MKLLKFFTNPLFLLVLVLSFLTVSCSSESTDSIPGITTTADDGSTTVDENILNDTLLALPLEQPDASEEAGLVFMREEEKLAHDVYIAMFSLGYSKVFDNISQSEQTHTDAILALLDRYNIPDPVGNNAEGVFVNADLQALYDALIVLGSPSLIEALYVGAEIEEIDILDIQRLVDALDGNEDIAIVYESLLKGSRNHLRSFVDNLANQGVDYAPKHLSQDVYDAIISAAMETN